MNFSEMQLQQMNIAEITDILAHLYKLERYDIIENYFILHRKELLSKIAKEFNLKQSKYCLIKAIKNGNLKYALALLALKKSPKIKDQEGNSILHLLMPGNKQDSKQEEFKNSLLEILISRYTLDFDCTNKDGMTPLMLAFNNSFVLKENGVWELDGGKDIIKKMIMYGADPYNGKALYSIWYVNTMMLASSAIFRILKDIALFEYIGEGIRKLVDCIERIIIFIKVYNDTKLYTYYKVRQYISKEYCRLTMINWLDACFIGCSHSNFLGLVSNGESLKDLLINCFGYYNLDKAVYDLSQLKISSEAERLQLLQQFVSRYAQTERQIGEAFFPWHKSSLKEVLHQIEESASLISLGVKPIDYFFACMEKICTDVEQLSLFLNKDSNARNVFYQLLNVINSGALQVDFSLRLKMHNLFNLLNQSYKEDKAFDSAPINKLFEQLAGILMLDNFIHYKEQDYNFFNFFIASQGCKLSNDMPKNNHSIMPDLMQSTVDGVFGAMLNNISKFFNIDKQKVEHEFCNGISVAMGGINAICLDNLNFVDKVWEIGRYVWGMDL